MHETYMRIALAQARKGAGRVSPNPMVGAVVVKGGRIVGRGYHRKAGTPHAEVHALARAGRNARGADLYVNLEPCAHFGRTPPCVDAIIAGGIRKVVMGMIDPNPLVSGKGISRLKRAGIEICSGVLEDDCRKLNEAYIKYITRGVPFVMLKVASSLDGKIATASGDSRGLTAPPAIRAVHRLRDRVDAILVGIGTVEADDPLLTTRLPGRPGKDPVRVIVDSRLRTSHRHIFAPGDVNGAFQFTHAAGYEGGVYGHGAILGQGLALAEPRALGIGDDARLAQQSRRVPREWGDRVATGNAQGSARAGAAWPSRRLSKSLLTTAE